MRACLLGLCGFGTKIWRPCFFGSSNQKFDLEIDIFVERLHFCTGFAVIFVKFNVSKSSHFFLLHWDEFGHHD